MTINDILSYNDDKFTHQSKALGLYLKNTVEWVILSDLLGKYCCIENSLKTHDNGKQYHYYYSKEDISNNDVFMDLKTYNRAIKRLEEKGLIKTFAERNLKDAKKKITYFFLDMNKIREAFLQGYKVLCNKEPQPLQAKETKEPKQPAKKQPTNKLTAQQQAELIQLENKYKAGFIDEETYNMRMKRITNIDNNYK